MPQTAFSYKNINTLRCQSVKHKSSKTFKFRTLLNSKIKHAFYLKNKLEMNVNPKLKIKACIVYIYLYLILYTDNCYIL